MLIVMTRKKRQKVGVKSMAKAHILLSKVSELKALLNWACSQFRYGGILYALAYGKLYFAFLKIFSVPENPCSCRGQNASGVSVFIQCPI
jgi:hypothetical protein